MKCEYIKYTTSSSLDSVLTLALNAVPGSAGTPICCAPEASATSACLGCIRGSRGWIWPCDQPAACVPGGLCPARHPSAHSAPLAVYAPLAACTMPPLRLRPAPLPTCCHGAALPCAHPSADPCSCRQAFSNPLASASNDVGCLASAVQQIPPASYGVAGAINGVAEAVNRVAGAVNRVATYAALASGTFAVMLSYIIRDSSTTTLPRWFPYIILSYFAMELILSPALRSWNQEGRGLNSVDSARERHDLLRAFFDTTATGRKLRQVVLQETKGKNVSTHYQDPATRVAIERCLTSC